MKSGSDNGVVAIAIGLILILLLSFGGVATYYVIARQYAAVARQADRALAAEARARMEAEVARENARAQAEAASWSRTTSLDEEASAEQVNSIRPALESVLRAQEDAWNRGDLDAFMDHYWKSTALTFSSGGKTTGGWTETLNRYRERYPTPEKMGRLRLSDLEVTPLTDSAALVLGQWSLERESEPVSGNFSLVFRKFDGRWLIVHDHTSQLID
jgi:beta-aspartyl-peptidase (threonine type)